MQPNLLVTASQNPLINAAIGRLTQNFAAPGYDQHAMRGDPYRIDLVHPIPCLAKRIIGIAGTWPMAERRRRREERLAGMDVPAIFGCERSEFQHFCHHPRPRRFRGQSRRGGRISTSCLGRLYASMMKEHTTFVAVRHRQDPLMFLVRYPLPRSVTAAVSSGSYKCKRVASVDRNAQARGRKHWCRPLSRGFCEVAAASVVGIRILSSSSCGERVHGFIARPYF
jgi:hypothetical protein